MPASPALGDRLAVLAFVGRAGVGAAGTSLLALLATASRRGGGRQRPDLVADDGRRASW